MKKSYGYKRILEKKLFFRYLLDDLSTSPCVFALINEKDNLIYIQASRDPFISIAKIASELTNKTFPNKQLRRDRRKLRVMLLQKYETKTQGLYRKQKWMDSFLRKGFTLYNKEPRPIYKVRSVFIDASTLEVQIVSKGKRVRPVRRFTSDLEMRDFVLRNTVWDMLEELENNSVFNRN